MEKINNELLKKVANVCAGRCNKILASCYREMESGRPGWEDDVYKLTVDFVETIERLACFHHHIDGPLTSEANQTMTVSPAHESDLAGLARRESQPPELGFPAKLIPLAPNEQLSNYISTLGYERVVGESGSAHVRRVIDDLHAKAADLPIIQGKLEFTERALVSWRDKCKRLEDEALRMATAGQA